MNNVLNYIYIQAWGRMMQSYPYYITDQIKLARADNAPVTAIYKREGKWRCIEDCCVGTQHEIENIITGMGDKGIKGR